MDQTVKGRKLHFIHQLEKSYVPPNQGDWIASPYYYFAGEFSRFTCVLHSAWSILWHEIDTEDVVIFGGGGLIDNSNALNDILNRLFLECDNVVIWGAGTHKYSNEFIDSCDDSNIHNIESATIPINFDKAALIGVRDYMHPYGLPFLPCASCLHPAFESAAIFGEIKREVGVISHGLDRFFEISDYPYALVSNTDPMSSIVKYICESNVLLVSTYHGAFWSMLLGKKVVILESRRGIEKYRYFRFPVGFYKDTNSYDEKKILDIASELPEPKGFLADARKLNLDFFVKVNELLEKQLEYHDDGGGNIGTILNLSRRIAQLEFTLRDLHQRLN